jgi:DNA-binding MarR family transcriptional regulator
MNTATLHPLIHHPGRLRIVATLAALPDGDTLSVTRLLDMTGLTSADLTTRLHELEQAGFVWTGKTRDGTAQTTVALTRDGRAAVDHYAAVLRQLPQMASDDQPAAYMRAADADRDAAAVSLGEHFAQGRLTLDELSARLEATLTATTHGELSQATRDLPHLIVLSDPAQRSRVRGKNRYRRGAVGL